MKQAHARWRRRIAPFMAVLAMPAFAAETARPHTAAQSVAQAGPSIASELFALVVPLVLVVVGLLVVLYLARRRFGLTGHDAPLSVVQILPVGPRERLVVVRTRGGRTFVVGTSAQSVRLVAHLDEDDLLPAAGEETTVGPGTPASTDSDT